MIDSEPYGDYTRCIHARVRSHLWQLDCAYCKEQLFMSEKSNRPESSWVLVVSVGVTALLIGGGLVAVYLQSQGNGSGAGGAAKPAPRKSPAAMVRVEEAVWKELGTVRTLNGRFVQVQSGTISSEVSGIVRELPVEVGTKVIGGETLIARIDDTWTKIALEQAEKQIVAIEVQLKFEENELKRLTPLVQNFTVSESDYFSQSVKVDSLKASLDLANVAKNEAKEKLARTVILAPFDGYVVRKRTEIGDLLAPGNPIVEIISSGMIDAEIHVNEEIIDRLNVGDKITVFANYLNAKAEGQVHSIVPYAPTAARNFPVYIRMSDEDGLFKVGMSVTAMIQTTDPEPGIVVPRDAVIDKPDGQTVWVVHEQTDEKGETQTIADPVPVKIRANMIDLYSVDPETAEGKALLVSGAKVVIEGGERLMPKQMVRIVPTDPKWFEGLPTGSGHSIIEPKQRQLEKIATAEAI